MDGWIHTKLLCILKQHCTVFKIIFTIHRQRLCALHTLINVHILIKTSFQTQCLDAEQRQEYSCLHFNQHIRIKPRDIGGQARFFGSNSFHLRVEKLHCVALTQFVK